MHAAHLSETINSRVSILVLLKVFFYIETDELPLSQVKECPLLY